LAYLVIGKEVLNCAEKGLLLKTLVKLSCVCHVVWGVDLVEEHLMACAGIPVRPPIAKKPLKHLAEYSVNAPVRMREGCVVPVN
jgi:hypothetical protein